MAVIVAMRVVRIMGVCIVTMGVMAVAFIRTTAGVTRMCAHQRDDRRQHKAQKGQEYNGLIHQLLPRRMSVCENLGPFCRDMR